MAHVSWDPAASPTSGGAHTWRCAPALCAVVMVLPCLLGQLDLPYAAWGAQQASFGNGARPELGAADVDVPELRTEAASSSLSHVPSDAAQQAFSAQKSNEPLCCRTGRPRVWRWLGHHMTIAGRSTILRTAPYLVLWLSAGGPCALPPGPPS